MKKRPQIIFIGRIDESLQGAQSVVRNQARVIVVGGASGVVTEEAIDAAERQIARSRIVVVSPSAALGIAVHAGAVAAQHGIRVILDPAPASSLREKLPRILALLPKQASSRMKRHAAMKKWRKRKPSVMN